MHFNKKWRGKTAAIAFSGGDLVVMDMARPGIIANLMGIVVSTLFAYTLGSLIYGMGGEAPEWAKFDSGEGGC